MPAVGEDPEARGLGRLSEGDTLEVPTGRSVLDVLQLSGMCEDGQLATRDEERREKQRKLEDSQRRMLAERALAEREATEQAARRAEGDVEH